MKGGKEVKKKMRIFSNLISFFFSAWGPAVQEGAGKPVVVCLLLVPSRRVDLSLQHAGHTCQSVDPVRARDSRMVVLK